MCTIMELMAYWEVKQKCNWNMNFNIYIMDKLQEKKNQDISYLKF